MSKGGLMQRGGSRYPRLVAQYDCLKNVDISFIEKLRSKEHNNGLTRDEFKFHLGTNPKLLLDNYIASDPDWSYCELISTELTNTVNNYRQLIGPIKGS